jgi:methyl-accepting chemotaxis protein
MYASTAVLATTTTAQSTSTSPTTQPAPTSPTRSRRRLRFADLALRSKILSLVGAAVLVTVSIGGFAQSALSSAQATAEGIVTREASPALTAVQAQTAFAGYRRFILDLIVASTPQEKSLALAGIARSEAQIRGALGDMASSERSADDVREIRAAIAGYATASGVFHDTLDKSARRTDLSRAEQVGLVHTLEAEFVPAADRAAASIDALVANKRAGMAAAVASGQASASRAWITLWSVAALGTLVLVVIGWWIASLVSGPVLRVKAAMEALADGDLTAAVDVTSADEVGRMAGALRRAQAVLRASMTTIVSSAATLAGSAEELSVVSAQVAASAEETSVQSGAAAGAADEVSRNVETVAAATEQMSASIREISRSSTDAVRVAQAAADEAQSATGTVARLGDSSKEVGAVVNVITSIAEQTNLLALNATIEAARAGEAGKGFAVVASEVKDLAQETARATEDISRRIEAIQADSAAAVAAIARISQIIEEVNSYQTTIASAVEEQTATTGEMSRSVRAAASGASSIASSIDHVATAARSSSTGILEAQRAAGELAQLSGDLRELVGGFRV